MRGNSKQQLVGPVVLPISDDADKFFMLCGFETSQVFVQLFILGDDLFATPI